MRLVILTLITSWIMVVSPIPAQAAVEAGVGGSCDGLLRTLKSRWMELRHIMEPPSADLDRPDASDFICVDPVYLRDSVERRVTTGAEVRCFMPRLASGMGICCDQRLLACAQLNPNKYEPQRVRPKEQAEPPKSLWVTPPSENDQWQSN